MLRKSRVGQESVESVLRKKESTVERICGKVGESMEEDEAWPHEVHEQDSQTQTDW